MSEPSSIRAQVYIPGKRKGGLRQQLTLEIISNWIKLQGFDEYTTNGLIQLASKYPTQALPSFRKNFNLMIERVRTKRRAELNEQQRAEAAALVAPKQTPELKIKENNGEENNRLDG
jgi:hypothetical protein